MSKRSRFFDAYIAVLWLTTNVEANIADGLHIGFVDIFGINSEKIIIFLELIPKKLYFCSGK